jgi:hypothetical protein
MKVILPYKLLGKIIFNLMKVILPYKLLGKIIFVVTYIFINESDIAL